MSEKPTWPKVEETILGPERELCAYLVSGLAVIMLVLAIGLTILGGWLWLR